MILDIFLCFNKMNSYLVLHLTLFVTDSLFSNKKVDAYVNLASIILFLALSTLLYGLSSLLKNNTSRKLQLHKSKYYLNKII